MPLGTLKEAIAKIGALPAKPAFMIHTGDITHLSKAEQFDNADQVIGGAGLDVHYVPGEHDVIDEDSGKAYLERYGKGSQGRRLVFASTRTASISSASSTSSNLKAGGLGNLGADQLAWLADDLKGRQRLHPDRGVRPHPAVDGLCRLGLGHRRRHAGAGAAVKRFGSVTVLNGHIHQIMQKVEGNITFHTARSTAFPQPAPGTAPAPGPMTVPADQLRSVLGITDVAVRHGGQELAITDSTLSDA